MGEEELSAIVPHTVTARSEEGLQADTLTARVEGAGATTETAALVWTEEGCPGTSRGDGDGSEDGVAPKTEKVMMQRVLVLGTKNVQTLTLEGDPTRHMEGGYTARLRILARECADKGIMGLGMQECRVPGPWTTRDDGNLYDVWFSQLPEMETRQWGVGIALRRGGWVVFVEVAYISPRLIVVWG